MAGFGTIGMNILKADLNTGNPLKLAIWFFE